jgi:hypothetical protein
MIWKRQRRTFGAERRHIMPRLRLTSRQTTIPFLARLFTNIVRKWQTSLKTKAHLPLKTSIRSDQIYLDSDYQWKYVDEYKRGDQ